MLEYFVEGMDCANCVRKVERMVATLPGAAEVKTSFNKQTLELRLDEQRTPRTQLEANLKSLGYAPSLRGGDVQGRAPHPDTGRDHAHAHDARTPAAEMGKPWYATGQGQLVVGSGVLLALAFTFSFIEPKFSVYGYVAATLLGSWPLLKKAVASARFGDVFSINLLVSLAAIGAVMIGQAAEGAVVVFFFAVGELLEGVAAGRARAGIQLARRADTQNRAAAGRRPGPRNRRRQLRIGQQVQVRPGDRVPADGRILAGTSSLDDSPLTGESVPVLKSVGDSVYAGSINQQRRADGGGRKKRPATTPSPASSTSSRKPKPAKRPPPASSTASAAPTRRAWWWPRRWWPACRRCCWVSRGTPGSTRPSPCC